MQTAVLGSYGQQRGASCSREIRIARRLHLFVVSLDVQFLSLAPSLFSVELFNRYELGGARFNVADINGINIVPVT